MEDRVRRLERAASHLRLAVGVLGAVAVLATLLAVAAVRSASHPAVTDVLRLRGLVLVDSAGRDRILLGAPLPASESRRREDPAVGVVILDEDGDDRIVVGAPKPDPQVGGEVYERVSPATGIQLNGPDGDERGGFSVMEDGRATMMLDHSEDRGEAVGMFVIPQRGLTGLLVNGVGEGPRQRVYLGVEFTGSDRGVLILNDSTGAAHTALTGLEGEGR